MILALIVALFFGLTGVQSDQAPTSGGPQDRPQEIADLLNQLAPELMRHNKHVWLGPPESPERIRAQLVFIANQSPHSRRNVIDALIRVLNDPKKQTDNWEVGRWRVAVALLGELNAIEAIDDLVRNINHTSYEMESRPLTPVKTALVRIGAPAVPHLLSALSDLNESIRRNASEALAEIGEPSVIGLLDRLANADPPARAGAADALARIDGVRVREAIEIALRLETNEDVINHLESAVRYMDHVECLRDSSKCK